MLEWLEGAWPILVTATAISLAALTAAHAVMYRRDARAALLWVGLVWLAPLVGSILYFFFGLNRVRRKAKRLREGVQHVHVEPCAPPIVAEELAQRLPDEVAHLQQLQHVVEQVVVRPLVPGNRIEPLTNGDSAFPAMLSAIDAAQSSISLSTYIFSTDPTGERFVSHLGAASRRGVAVRVLVDDVGAHYSWPRITRSLRRSGVRHALFHARSWLLPSRSFNLRNHRKICVVDGRIGFTGGMNINQSHVLADHAGRPVRDLHFRIEGPVVAELQEVFTEDWTFTTGEPLEGELWFPAVSGAGPGIARAIADGPDENLNNLRWCLLGALSIARRSVHIVTPYFLPDTSLISALNVAAMRGVKVDILIPAKTNVPLVQWATRGTIWQVLQHGCRVWLSPTPFDHTKLMIVDDCWILVGSANWDARSLRLNFELNVETYDLALADELRSIVNRKRAESRELTLDEVDARGIPERLRDGVARLFSPVL